jgi:hypothetical protein
MSVDAKAFRRTVGHFVTGVTVVAADIEGTTRAMTANALTSLSLDPPLVLFCVAKKAHLGQAIHRASGFSVNILTQEQQPLSDYFAGGWKNLCHRRSGSSLGKAGLCGWCRCSRMRGRDDSRRRRSLYRVGRVQSLYQRSPRPSRLSSGAADTQRWSAMWRAVSVGPG